MFTILTFDFDHIIFDLHLTYSQVTSSTWALEMSEETFRTWDVESNHSYCNNMNITLSFIYPGAIKFVVEFDPRCETERR